MNAQAIIRKLDKLFQSLQVTDRAVYKRLLSRGGGDPLIGRHTTVTKTDTLLSPQPVVQVPTEDNPLVLTGTELNLATDYLLLVSPTSMTADQIRNKDYLFVFKDSGGDEECAVIGYVPVVLKGTVLAFNVAVRSRKRA